MCCCGARGILVLLGSALGEGGHLTNAETFLIWAQAHLVLLLRVEVLEEEVCLHRGADHLHLVWTLGEDLELAIVFVVQRRVVGGLRDRLSLLFGEAAPHRTVLPLVDIA